MVDYLSVGAYIYEWYSYSDFNKSFCTMSGISLIIVKLWKVEISFLLAAVDESLGNLSINVDPSHEFITNGWVIWPNAYLGQKSRARESSNSNVVGERDKGIKLLLSQNNAVAYQSVNLWSELYFCFIKEFTVIIIFLVLRKAF